MDAPTLNGLGVMECESRLPVKGDNRRIDKRGADPEWTEITSDNNGGEQTGGQVTTMEESKQVANA